MGRRLAYLPLYVLDFLTDPLVLRMTWIEQAIHLRMLMASWEAGPLPNDVDMIARMIDGYRLNHELSRARYNTASSVRLVLGACWVRTKEGWISRRLEDERAYARSVVETNRRRTEAATDARRRRDVERDVGRDGPRNEVQPQDQDQSGEKKPPYPLSKGGKNGALGGRKKKRGDPIYETDVYGRVILPKRVVGRKPVEPA